MSDLGCGRIAGAGTVNGEKVHSVLFVESRPKHQDTLRDYFTKHGYRPLVLRDADRAVDRLKTAPPDAVVLMGDDIGDRVAGDFRAVAGSGVATVLVLGRDQKKLGPKLGKIPKTAKVLVQPVTPRGLRDALTECLAAAG